MNSAQDLKSLSERSAVSRLKSSHLEQVEGLSASAPFNGPPHWKKRLGLEQAKIGSARLIVMRNSKNSYYNRLIGFGLCRRKLTPRDLYKELDEAIDRANRLKAKGLTIEVGPHTRPAGVSKWLLSRGFSEAEPVAKLWRDNSLPEKSSVADLTIKKVGPSDALLWATTAGRTLSTFQSRAGWYESRVELPGFHHFLATIDGEPAGTGALFVAKIGGKRIGHLIDGTTRREYRRRGVQSAMIRHRLRIGRKLGCTLFSSETAPPLPRRPLVSYRNLLAAGFSLAYLRVPFFKALR